MYSYEKASKAIESNIKLRKVFNPIAYIID